MIILTKFHSTFEFQVGHSTLNTIRTSVHFKFFDILDTDFTSSHQICWHILRKWNPSKIIKLKNIKNNCCSTISVLLKENHFWKDQGDICHGKLTLKIKNLKFSRTLSKIWVTDTSEIILERNEQIAQTNKFLSTFESCSNFALF